MPSKHLDRTEVVFWKVTTSDENGRADRLDEIFSSEPEFAPSVFGRKKSLLARTDVASSTRVLEVFLNLPAFRNQPQPGKGSAYLHCMYETDFVCGTLLVVGWSHGKLLGPADCMYDGHPVEWANSMKTFIHGLGGQCLVRKVGIFKCLDL